MADGSLDDRGPATGLTGVALRALIADRLAAFRPLDAAAPDQRAAAVAVVVVDDPAEPSFLLTLRSATLTRHAGQYALPGGRVDPGESPERAVLREIAEELGAVLEPSAILGRLDDYVTRSGFRIVPHVVWADAGTPITPDPSEVAAVYPVPLAGFARPGVATFARIPQSERPVVQLQFDVTGTIFAPTAAMLYQFMQVCLLGRAVRVADLEQPVFAWK